MGLYRDQGVVLRTVRLGEADRIVTFATQGHGKVRAVAKGVRKTRSRFGGRLEPTAHVTVLFYEGRELDVVTQVETLDHFRAIRDDLERLRRAAAMLEAVDHLAQERQPNPRLYTMLVGALRALAAHNAPLLLAGFFWKALSLEGFHPFLDACVLCGDDASGDDASGDDASGDDASGDDADLVAFDLAEGGVLCRSCRRGAPIVPITPRALALVRQILGGELAAALAQAESATNRQVEHLATRALEHHLERRLRSVPLL